MAVQLLIYVILFNLLGSINKQTNQYTSNQALQVRVRSLDYEIPHTVWPNIYDERVKLRDELEMKIYELQQGQQSNEQKEMQTAIEQSKVL